MDQLSTFVAGEVIQQMTPEEASSITTQIAVKLDAIAENYQAVMPLIREAITRQAHFVLGYASPGAYVADQFGNALSRLGVDLRREVVKELSGAGLSTRAIGAALGVDQKTVVNDRRAGEENSSPAVEQGGELSKQGEPVSRDVDGGSTEPANESRVDWEAKSAAALDRLEEIVSQPPRITGVDGKSYPAPKPSPKKPNRRPLPDVARDAGWELRKTVEKLDRLLNDDRFTRNREEMAVQLRGHLTYAIDSCQGFLDRLPADEAADELKGCTAR